LGKLYRFLFFGTLLLLSEFVWAQKDTAVKNETAVKEYTTQFETEYSKDRNLSLVYEDTAMRRNEIYSHHFRRNSVFQDLGNLGTPGRNLFFTWNRNSDFVLGFNPYQNFYKTVEGSKYYKSKKPYADFTYTQGQRELLIFKAKYTYNITPRLNIGVDFDRVTSQGFYPRQYTSGYYTNVFGSYETKNKKYGIIGNAIWNRGVLDESGGIRSDSLFESLRGPNKAAPVQLYKSESRFRSNSVFAKQYFYLGKLTETVDNEDTSYYLSRTGFISHTFRVDRDNFFFDNPKGDTSVALFPAGSGIDSTGIFSDSVSSKTIMNRLAYAYWTKSNEFQQSYIEFALAHKYIEVYQMGLFNTYQNLWGEAKLERLPKTDQNIGLRLGGSYCVWGYNANDVKLGGDIKFLFKALDVNGGLENTLSEPDFTLVHYKSAPFTWDNKYSKINVTHWHAGMGTKRYKHNFTANFNQYIIANWVYFGKQVSPEQSSEILVINTLEASKTFQLGWFFFENKLMLQKANLAIVRMPELSGNLRYYVNGNLFKKVVRMQLGAEVFYNTAYYANAYNPAARAFYLQDQTKVGNYPLIDVFLTAQVKTAVIYLKFEHVNMDWQNSGYYYTPHYPFPVRAFRFGLRLRLYN